MPRGIIPCDEQGNERRDIFLDDADRGKFLGILEDYHERYGMIDLQFPEGRCKH
ncbi:MAG: hypothetical protein JSW12_13830 [Deltaproteobacteria bacterium]|nr:MAG: hypothetical protein JSW12_13830 [Deltaproteobacteria bacterium]